MKWEIKGDTLYVDRKKYFIIADRQSGEYDVLLIQKYRWVRPNVEMFTELFFAIGVKELYNNNIFNYLYKASYNLLTEIAIIHGEKLLIGEDCRDLIESNVMLNKLTE